MCDCCGREVESTMHTTKCTTPGWWKMFELRVWTLTDWMNYTGVDVILVDMIEEYLLAQGEKTMLECLRYSTEAYASLAGSTDRLR